MKASITKIPEGTTVVSQLNGEFYFYKPIEGELVVPEGHQPPRSMVWCTDEMVDVGNTLILSFQM